MKSNQLIKKCKVGKRTKIYNFVNLYECEIGDDCRVGSFVEMQKGVKVGNRVKIQSHTFICEGVTIHDEAFIGHHVVFVNDKYPRSINFSGKLQEQDDWQLLETVVAQGASIGSNATILGGIKIGENAIIGAGSVVIKNVPANTIVAGNPARVVRKIK